MQTKKILPSRSKPNRPKPIRPKTLCFSRPNQMQSLDYGYVYGRQKDLVYLKFTEFRGYSCMQGVFILFKRGFTLTGLGGITPYTYLLFVTFVAIELERKTM